MARPKTGWEQLAMMKVLPGEEMERVAKMIEDGRSVWALISNSGAF